MKGVKILISMLVLVVLSFQAYSQYSDFHAQITNNHALHLGATQVLENEPPTLFDARKNSVSLDFILIFPAAGYSRIIPFHNKAGVIASVSLTPSWGFTAELSGGFIFGKHRHFIEPSAGYLFKVANSFVKLGYRFQGDKGLVLKVAPGWSLSGNLLYFTSGIGYAF